MPYKIVRNNDRRTYRVVNARTGKILAYRTTLKKAFRQVTFMNEMDYSLRPRRFF